MLPHRIFAGDPPSEAEQPEDIGVVHHGCAKELS